MVTNPCFFQGSLTFTDFSSSGDICEEGSLLRIFHLQAMTCQSLEFYLKVWMHFNEADACNFTPMCWFNDVTWAFVWKLISLFLVRFVIFICCWCRKSSFHYLGWWANRTMNGTCVISTGACGILSTKSIILHDREGVSMPNDPFSWHFQIRSCRQKGPRNLLFRR